MCAFSAYQALLNCTKDGETLLERSKDVAVVYLSDNEELGSVRREGAKGNFLDSVVERITEIFATECVPDHSKPLRYPPPPSAKKSPAAVLVQFSYNSFSLSRAD